MIYVKLSTNSINYKEHSSRSFHSSLSFS